ncbi:MAG: hypothetical protein LBT27_01380 [Prevotellaceae bacterium]|jgi:hypothetical protein|nr:hypothetical protein [Prevotellaceae bacterium]
MNKLYYLLFILFFFSCKEKFTPAPEPPVALPERTILVYLCGDNNLSSEIDIKIDALHEGMKNIGKTDNHLIVYADYNDKMPKLVEIKADGITLIEQYAELNSASAVNFANILQKVFSKFSAKSYGLICFSHASGWLPKGALNNPSGYNAASYNSDNSLPVTQSIFEDNGQEMSIAEFADAIQTEDGKLKFIIFETCYMAGVEVVYELRNKTEYIISSAAEMLSNGLADIYPDNLSDLFAPEPRLKTFAKAYFDYRNNMSGTSRSATISLINTAKMDDLAAVVKTIYNNNAAFDIGNIQHFNRNQHHLFFDLSDFIEIISTNQQKADYEQIIFQIVEYQDATPQFMRNYEYSFTINKHCGLTTYIKQALFPNLNAEYDNLNWGWYLVVGI